MSDPERLLTGASGQHELERSLLGTLRVLTVPAQARGLVWDSLSGAFAEVAAPAGAAPLWHGAFKLLVSQKALFAVPVLVAALGAGVVVRQRAHQPTPPTVARAVVAATLPATEPALAPAEAAPEAEVTAPTEATEPSAPRRAALGERLRQESALLTRARAELRGGNARAAQATLTRMQRAFGNGGLGQERAVLNIQALAAEGDAAAAARGARAFIAAHPESPHVPALRRFLTEP
ncbi:MAG: hypothetical protein ABI548_21100 [Polyangiaceae bacterium]